MPVSAAFLLVVIIWSTTPLGIVWSSESISPTFSLLMRMTVAICVGSVLMVALKVKLQWTLKAVRIYLYSSLSVAIGMLFCYLAARHISSGLMSLTFGIAPILSGLLAQKILFEQKFSLLKKVALLISLSGLAIVCSENVTFGATSLLGLGYVFIAVLLFSLSSVLVKSVDIEIHPLSTTMGSLIVSLPFFLVFWLVADGQVNYQDWQPRAIAAVLYLGVFASLIGFLAYFFILQKLPASTVALVVMITPVISTGLGILLNDEHMSWLLIVGGGFVVLGLGLFQFGHKVKWFRAKA
jgi:drug/metabolite transporter (DMT)-like permease